MIAFMGAGTLDSALACADADMRLLPFRSRIKKT